MLYGHMVGIAQGLPTYLPTHPTRKNTMIFQKENHPLSFNVYSNGEFDEKKYFYIYIYIYILSPIVQPMLIYLTLGK
jgi:hypothetical protein